VIKKQAIIIIIIIIVVIFKYALQPLRLFVRSGLDIPTFATRRLHSCHHSRANNGRRWNFGRKMSRNFA
jgi:sterol desaturase/sphingolipid hydroxylase (fatty acid hydroxylase superfamily)